MSTFDEVPPEEYVSDYAMPMFELLFGDDMPLKQLYFRRYGVDMVNFYFYILMIGYLAWSRYHLMVQMTHILPLHMVPKYVGLMRLFIWIYLKYNPSHVGRGVIPVDIVRCPISNRMFNEMFQLAGYSFSIRNDRIDIEDVIDNFVTDLVETAGTDETVSYLDRIRMFDRTRGRNRRRNMGYSEVIDLGGNIYSIPAGVGSNIVNFLSDSEIYETFN